MSWRTWISILHTTQLKRNTCETLARWAVTSLPGIDAGPPRVGHLLVAWLPFSDGGQMRRFS